MVTPVDGSEGPAARALCAATFAASSPAAITLSAQTASRQKSPASTRPSKEGKAKARPAEGSTAITAGGTKTAETRVGSAQKALTCTHGPAAPPSTASRPVGNPANGT